MKDYNADLKIEYVPIETIKPYDNNPRINKGAIPALKESIKGFRFSNPITVDGNGVVISGHTRLEAAKALGMKKVPIIKRVDLTEEQAKALRLADNKVGELSEWDFDKLKIELGEMPTFDLESFGFDLSAFTDAEEIKGKTDDDYVPEIEDDQEPISKRGEVYLLGDHRLMCGNSTTRQDVDKLINGAKIDMVMTDPPYGISAEKMTMGSGKKGFYRGKDWDESRPDISVVFDLAPLVCVWGGNYFADKLPVTNDWLIWHKKNDGLSFSECELAWTNFKINCRILSHHWGAEKKQHVTMKPLEVIVWAISKAKTNPETVIDLFGGSGTTIIACEKTQRKGFAMELDPVYCDVIRKRWAEYVHGEGCDWVSLTPKEN